MIAIYETKNRGVKLSKIALTLSWYSEEEEEEEELQFKKYIFAAEQIMDSLVFELEPMKETNDPQFLHYFFSCDSRDCNITLCVYMRRDGSVFKQIFVNTLHTSKKEFQLITLKNFFQMNSEGLKFLRKFEEEITECTKSEYRYLLVTIYSNDEDILFLTKKIIEKLTDQTRLIIESITIHLSYLPKNFFTIISMATGQVLSKLLTFL